MIPRSTLTDQEIQAAYLARFDLGPGYPQLRCPDSLADTYGSVANDVCLRHAPYWSSADQVAVDTSLDTSLKRLLRIDAFSQGISVHSTFSGSVALDRAVAAIDQFLGHAKIVFITTTPCIDIMRFLLSERANFRTRFVASCLNGNVGELDRNKVAEEIEFISTTENDAKIVLLLSSPENPTGAVWSRDDLTDLCKLCHAYNVILLIDHCFALSGVHLPDQVTRIWELDAECKWIAVWDTGKTFGFNEEKLGFIITCGAMNEHVSQAVGTIQFGVARRLKILFSKVFEIAASSNYLDHLREICSINRNRVISIAPGRYPIHSFTAGSLLLLDVSASGQTDDQIRDMLLARGIGVVSGRVFFHNQWKPKEFIRLALARDSSYFEEAVTKIFEAIP